jgi:protein TonB
MMKTRLVISLAAGMLAGCAGHSVDKTPVAAPGNYAAVETTPSGTSVAMTVADYKQALAQRIAEVNSTKVYIGRPQALLRSVIVVRYAVDARGNLMRSEIIRTNHDRTTEATALASLRNTAPFPKPASHLLQRGRVEISETWLFNNDGRFQLRTIAEPQMNE